MVLLPLSLGNAGSGEGSPTFDERAHQLSGAPCNLPGRQVA